MLSIKWFLLILYTHPASYLDEVLLSCNLAQERTNLL